ncbi:MAG: TVP38/TMEM64 family protein [Alphaproteobacteria bacterium]|nr:TVP38/TMEM64 family protein [Alphaproteobacteria bacterium]
MDAPTGDSQAGPAAPRPAGDAPAKRFAWWKALPIVVIAGGAAAVFLLGLHRYVSFGELARHREDLLAWVASHGQTAPLLFMLAYAFGVAFSLPVIGAFTAIAGFLFGLLPGAAYSVIAATVGAAALHAATYTTIGAWITRRADSSHMLGAAIERMRAGFQRDAFSYILFLRVVPVFPGFVTNLVPAMMGVPLGTYVLASFIGFVPVFLVLSSIGSGIGAIIARGATPDLSMMFEAPILLPLAGLGVLALVPIAYRRFAARRG